MSFNLSITHHEEKSNVIPFPDYGDIISTAGEILLRTRNLMVREVMRKTIVRCLENMRKNEYVTRSGLAVENNRDGLRIYPLAIGNNGECPECHNDVYLNGKICYVYPSGNTHEVIWSCGNCRTLFRTIERGGEDE